MQVGSLQATANVALQEPLLYVERATNAGEDRCGKRDALGNALPLQVRRNKTWKGSGRRVGVARKQKRPGGTAAATPGAGTSDGGRVV